MPYVLSKQSMYPAKHILAKVRDMRKKQVFAEFVERLQQIKKALNAQNTDETYIDTIADAEEYSKLLEKRYILQARLNARINDHLRM